MDFISMGLVTLSQPAGFWESILNAFKGAMGSYILAVILIALLVRILFSIVDIVNKKVTMKNSDIQSKMKPELEAVQKRYGNDQQMLQQKQSEIYKKYQFNMMGSCLPMLITMILQFVVFLTLWNSLQSVSNYNIAFQYQNMKNIYANVLDLNDETNAQKNALQMAINELNESGATYTLQADIDFENNKMKIVINQEEQKLGEYEFDYVQNYSNSEVYGIIEKYVPQPVQDPNQTEGQVEEFYKNGIIQKFAEEVVKDYYFETREGFLWIKNIYKAEAPTNSPMFTESEIVGYLSKYYNEEEKAEEETNKYEAKIFGNVVAGIDTSTLGVNGYYILTIIAVATSVLSMWLSNFLMRRKDQPKQKQSWAMYIIMPVIIGIFTFMYTSLFAVYLIVGQLVMLALTPLTTFIVKKWTEHDDKKKKDKDIVEVDYRRKDI